MSAASAVHGTFVRSVKDHRGSAGPRRAAYQDGFAQHDGAAGRGGSGYGNVYPINAGRRESVSTSAPSTLPAMGSVGRQGKAGLEKQPPLRLTRRGRFVFFGVPLILLAAFLLSLSGFLNAPAKAADSADQLSVTPTVSVTVQPGESLWAIAGSVAPGRDPRDVVADIVQLNNLDAARVMPGQQLFVPAK
ncbi:LysM domain-containing protein [Arthrobacter oryzae]|uniref:LysM domain-containing protein n=2 Tax=Arthrobacter oryzae TaxID=409290 RepID=A0A495EUB8_9MICC|nr:LysM domain-containing protein [Arthrobacter oryzae]